MRPKARRAGLIQEALGPDVVVYDLKRHEAHRLNRTTALVWSWCDGRTTVAEMAARLSVELNVVADERLVWLALRQLHAAHLLLGRWGAMPEGSTVSRRQLLATGLAGAATLLLPGCESVVAPAPDFNLALDPGEEQLTCSGTCGEPEEFGEGWKCGQGTCKGPESNPKGCSCVPVLSRGRAKPQCVCMDTHVILDRTGCRSLSCLAPRHIDEEGNAICYPNTPCIQTLLDCECVGRSVKERDRYIRAVCRCDPKRR